MGWHMPWYSAQASLDYVRDGDRVFESYWTTRRGVEALDYSYALMDQFSQPPRQSRDSCPALATCQ